MKSTFTVAAALAGSLAVASAHAGPAETYGPYPVTVKGYAGSKTDSVSYSGQVARHLLNNALKKLAGRGNGTHDAGLQAQMMAYFAGSESGHAILDPTSKDGFRIRQTMIEAISKDKNLKGKTYKGLVAGFPGQMTGPEAVEFMIGKAAAADKGFDPVTGYDYPQIISKFLLGAVFYNQAVDGYLDEYLEADKKPNDQPYREGAAYTGKEHAWDEAFGYFGVPAHALALTPQQAYDIAKRKDAAAADANGDGEIDLVREMTYGPGYYAADADKGGSDYMHTITRAFIDGRKLLASAGGEKLSDAQRATLKGHADTIRSEWEKVMAEAAFKYAGATYKDLEKLRTIVESNGDATKAFRAYGKHWGELKGFALALQTSGRDLGETAVRLNRLIGYGPVLLGGGQVTGIDGDGNYVVGGNQSMGEYMSHLIKVQAVLALNFDLEVRKNDVTGRMKELMETLGNKKSVEND